VLLEVLKKHVDIVGCSIFIATFETTSESGGTTLRMVLALMVMMVDLHQRMHEALYYTFARTKARSKSLALPACRETWLDT